jgi:hypothetical protein
MKFLTNDAFESFANKFYTKIKNGYATKAELTAGLSTKADVSHGTHLVLGTTSSTAFRGDRGNTAYNHSQAAHAPSNAQKNSDITIDEIEAKLVGTITSHSHVHPVSGVTAGSYGNSANKTPAYGATFNVPYITVNTEGHITAIANKTVKIPATDNTWRGIQDNLTSTSTTDSLSANQGKVLKGLIDTHTASTHLTIGTGAGNAAAGNHTHSSYVNQNAFSNVTVGSTTIAADSTTDTLTLVAGSNVTITPDATNDKITIAATNTTYSAATTSANGLMTAAMVTKLNGIATGANKYSLPAATSSALGGVKIGSNISVSSGTISLSSTNIKGAGGVVSAASKDTTSYTDLAV